MRMKTDRTQSQTWKDRAPELIIYALSVEDAARAAKRRECG